MQLRKHVQKLFNALIILCLLGSLMPIASATEYVRVYSASAHKYVYVPRHTTLKTRAKRAWHNPVVKKAAIGAGIGAGVGLLSPHTSILKGAVVGTAAGAGVGLVSKSRTMQRHPLAKTAANGAIIGTGVGALTHVGLVKGAVIGAGAGAGYHYIKKYWDKHHRD